MEKQTEFRPRLSKEEFELVQRFRSGLDVENTSETSPNDYEAKPFRFNAISNEGKLLNIKDYCTHYGLDYSKISSYKLISHSATPFYNIVFKELQEAKVEEIDIDFIVKKYIQPIKRDYALNTYYDEDYFDRLVLTDIHIGMDVSGKNKSPLYDGKWDREELLLRLDNVLNHISNLQKGKDLIIDNLGDYLDGLGGQTTRKGHELPQNMTDQEMFDVGLEFSLLLLESISDMYQNITYNFLICDNHSGNFSYFVGKAIKGIVEAKYDNIKVNVITKFISHYKLGKHTFILCHGKDDESLKFGFKPKLDDAQAKKIDEYCKENGLYDGNYIEFSKGDSHQSIFDETTSKDFDYYNYPAFSSPSNWVKLNFSNSRSGFRFFNISLHSNIKNHFPYWF
jgi:nitrite reductase/ring-hydroxylating ferredoxin subunit